ncbi:MAG: hypothetical protein IT289_03090 [Oligoflexia bacterium]|nr:hypothetical protein [Oligoflexia bacterium]
MTFSKAPQTGQSSLEVAVGLPILILGLVAGLSSMTHGLAIVLLTFLSFDHSRCVAQGVDRSSCLNRFEALGKKMGFSELRIHVDEKFGEIRSFANGNFARLDNRQGQYVLFPGEYRRVSK